MGKIKDKVNHLRTDHIGPIAYCLSSYHFSLLNCFILYFIQISVSLQAYSHLISTNRVETCSTRVKSFGVRLYYTYKRALDGSLQLFPDAILPDGVRQKCMYKRALEWNTLACARCSNIYMPRPAKNIVPIHARYAGSQMREPSGAPIHRGVISFASYQVAH